MGESKTSSRIFLNPAPQSSFSSRSIGAIVKGLAVTSGLGFGISGTNGRTASKGIINHGLNFGCLDEFLGQYPELQIEFDYSYRISDFAESNNDGALRYGLTDRPDTRMRLIHYDRVVPVASPALIKGTDLPLSPELIANLPLAAVSGQERYRHQWFETAGLSDHRKINWSKHEQRALALDFALAGNAVALADLPLVRNELANGALVRLSDIEITLDRGIHLAEPLGPFSDARLTAFGDWLTDHVGKLTAVQ